MEAVSRLVFKSYSLRHKSDEEVNAFVEALEKAASGYTFTLNRGRTWPTLSTSVRRARHVELLALAKQLNGNAALHEKFGWHRYELEASDFAAAEAPLLTEANRAVLDMPLAEFEISDTRVLTAIKSGLLPLLHPEYQQQLHLPKREQFVLYIGDVVANTWDELRAFNQVGPVGLAEFEARLLAVGVGFGMDTHNWPRPQKVQAKPIPSREVLTQRLDSLPFSESHLTIFSWDGLVYLGDLVVKSESEITRNPGCGPKNLAKMKAVLDELGCEFEMKLSDWPPEGLPYP